MVRTRFALAMLLMGTTALAQKPWENRVNIPLPAPVQLPAIPATNPFAAPVASPPVVTTSPMVEKLEETFPVRAAIYVNASGEVQRVVMLDVPLPGSGDDVRQALAETGFAPAHSLAGTVPAWVDVGVDLKGRIDEGSIVGLHASSPNPGEPPTPAEEARSPADPQDRQLPTTAPADLDQLPQPKRFRAKVSGHTWRQEFTLLAEVSPEGHCTRVVFLACPEGLRPWFLASLAAWNFRPAQGDGGPVLAWVRLEGAVEVKVGTLRSSVLRVTRESSYPQ
jgi:hypothetical protein